MPDHSFHQDVLEHGERHQYGPGQLKDQDDLILIIFITCSLIQFGEHCQQGPG